VLSRVPGRLGELLRDEPAATESLAAGADVVCLSGDKLLGGPQAGIAVGKADAIERLRRHPLARAVRIDKLSLAALEATLRLHRDPEEAAAQVPVLEMLAADEHDLLVSAARIHDALAAGAPANAELKVIRSSGRAGGGALPLLELEGPVVSLRSGAGAHALAEQLRLGEPAVIGRIQDDAVLLDPRTVSDVEVDFLVRAARTALHALA
jgi:L-seryl-tRNA(Ser) seleniumtransferase